MTWIDNPDDAIVIRRPEAVELNGDIRAGIAALFVARDTDDTAAIDQLMNDLRPKSETLSADEILELRAVSAEHEGRRRHPHLGPMFLVGWSDTDLHMPVFRVVDRPSE